jgi:hypothetical protein
MEDVLQSLANLQYLDSKIDEISRLKGDLPEEIQDIEAEIVRIDNQIKHFTAEEEALKQESKRLSAAVEESYQLVERYEKQQMTVRNNREYDAITKEIEAHRTMIDQSKLRVEDIGLLLEQMAKNMGESQRLLDDNQRLVEEKKTQLEDLNQRTAEEEKQLFQLREKAAAEVGERYLRSYERLRAGLHNNIAVVAMERGSCLGFMLPPQVQMEVKRKTKIIIDENSGRIVIDASFFESAQKNYG